MTKPVMQIELQQLLDTAPLRDQLEGMEPVMSDIKVIYDDEARRELPSILRNNESKEDLIARFELLATLIQSADNIETLAEIVDSTYQAELDRYEENMQVVFSQTKPFEKTARSLNLLYLNARGDANVYIMPVSSERFADAATPRHFELFRHFLRHQFNLWEMEDSPFYISYVGDIGSKSAMDMMASIAQETRALAVVDIAEKSTAQAVSEYADRLKISGIPAHLAHLVVLGTWVYAHKAVEVEFNRDEQGLLRRNEKPMSVPAAGAFIGKMMSVPPGYFITGLEQSAIVGINGVKVKYDLQRKDAKAWDERGLIQIEPRGHIQGATTANKSNNNDLRKFPKVDVANALLKDLVQFCNRKAFSKWGERQRRDAQFEIEIYLNKMIKRDVIEGYQIKTIRYDKNDETVEIEIAVQFFEVADKFNINLHGSRNDINIKGDQSKTG